MKKKFGLFFLSLVFLINLIVYPIKSDAGYKYDDFTDLKGELNPLNIVTYGAEPSSEVSGDYNSILFPSKDTTYEVVGNSKIPMIEMHNAMPVYNPNDPLQEKVADLYTLNDPNSNDPDNPTKTILFSYAQYKAYQAAGKGEVQKVTAKKAGLYKGAFIDVVLEVKSMTFDMDRRIAIRNYSSLTQPNPNQFKPTYDNVANEDHLGIKVNLLSPADRSNEKDATLTMNLPLNESDKKASLKLKNSFFAFGAGATETQGAIKKDGTIGNQFLSSNFYTGSYLEDEEIVLEFSFRYSATPDEIIADYKGVWNWANLTGAKTLSLDVDSIDNLYIYDTNSVHDADVNTLRYDPSLSLPNIRIMGDLKKATDTNAQTDSLRMTQLVSGNNMVVKFERNNTSDRANGTVLSNFTNQRGPVILAYGKDPIPRVAPTIPSITGERNSVDNKDDKYHQLSYSIVETVAANSKINRDKQYKIESVLPEGYTFDEDATTVEVLNESESDVNGNDVNKNGANLFNISYSSDQTKIILTAKDPSQDDFIGNVYKINVIANKKGSVDGVKDRFELAKDLNGDSFIADGYLNYELGKSGSTILATNDKSATTSIIYEYGKGISNQQDAEKIENQSNAEVRHLSDLTFVTDDSQRVEKETKIADEFPKPEEFITKLTVDDTKADYTGSNLQALITSGKITVKYANPSLTTSDEAGGKTDVKLIVTLNENDVEREFEVTAKVYNKGAYLVKFLGNNAATDDGEIASLTINYPQDATIDLTKDKDILAKISSLKKEGYTDVNYFPLDNGSNAENAYKPAGPEDTIIYRVNEPNIQITIPKTAKFANGTVNPGISQTLMYDETNDFSIKIKDLRTFSTDKADARNGRGKLKIQAYRSDFVDSSDSSKSLNNVSLWWNQEKKKDKQEISDSSNPLTVYSNDEVKVDDPKTDVIITMSSVDHSDENRLELEVDKYNNAEAKTYVSTITWDLIYAP